MGNQESTGIVIGLFDIVGGLISLSLCIALMDPYQSRQETTLTICWLIGSVLMILFGLILIVGSVKKSTPCLIIGLSYRVCGLVVSVVSISLISQRIGVGAICGLIVSLVFIMVLYKKIKDIKQEETNRNQVSEFADKENSEVLL